MAGHTGRRIDLEQEVGARLVTHQINTAPPARTRRLEGPERKRSHLGVGGRLEARTEILRVVSDVLRVVVIVAFRRHDTDRRQRCTTEDCDRVFAALDQCLHQQLAGVAGRQLNRGRQLLCCIHSADAHAGALERRLDDERQTDTRRRCADIAAARQPFVPRRWQLVRDPDFLGPNFVERQRRTEHPRTGIRNAEGLEDTLGNAIFAGSTMHDIEDTVVAMRDQSCHQRGNTIHCGDIDAATNQRLADVAPGLE